MSESFVQPEYISIYNKVAEIVKNRKVTNANVMFLVGVAMEVVEKNKELSGEEKKELVINIIKEVVRKSKSIPDKETVYASIDMMAPGAIDLIVAGANGLLNINLDTSGCSGCFKSQKSKPQTAARDLATTRIKKLKNPK